jgi:IS5 family transposase
MHQTKKGNHWSLGMKVHAAVAKDSGLNHSVVVTASNMHDLTPAAELVHGIAKGLRWEARQRIQVGHTESTGRVWRSL